MGVQLDHTAKQKVQYAIPLWLRDEQIRASVQRITGRVEPHPERPDPIAIVAYGPSLQETWEKVRDFAYVMTCSGSHRFLIDRGIIPTWHVEVDPRAHKVGLLGEPHPDVEYLISSTCHPQYFDHLDGYTVKLWHVFDASEEGVRLLPPGEWALTGGCDVGLRSLTIAGFLGFRDLHIFGMDGSASKEGNRHGGPHPNGVALHKYGEVVFNGETYLTTPAMLEAANGVEHELRQMPTIRPTFYGKGLIQAKLAGYVPAGTSPDRPMENVVGFAKPELISRDYAKLNAKLHREVLSYGVGGGKHAPVVLSLVESMKAKSVLDYGSGKGYLAKALPFPIWEYDPAIPGKDTPPRPADLVVCSDVLEHIEPDRLVYVLQDLARCTKLVGYLVIHTGPAQKTLADGRNAHLIQQPLGWWKKTLQKFFQVGKVMQKGPELYVVVGPLKRKGSVSVARASAVVSQKVPA